MRITTKAEYLWDDTASAYVLVAFEGYEYSGPVEFAKAEGPSGAQQNIAQQQQQFYGTLQSDFGQQFANQNNILNTLNKSLSPIVNAGIGQYGYTNAEDAAMRNQASSGTAGAYQNAKRATGEAQAAQGGGNQFLGSGVKAQQDAALSNSAAQQDASQQLGITQGGYATGRQNYLGAVSAEQGVAAAYNPAAYGGLADSAGGAAYGSASNNQQLKAAADAANNPWGPIGGALGGVAGAFLGGPMGASIGSSLGSRIGNGVGGGGFGSSAVGGSSGGFGGILGGLGNSPGSSNSGTTPDDPGFAWGLGPI